MSQDELLRQPVQDRPHHLATDWAGRINPDRAELERRIGHVIDPSQSELSNRQRRKIEKHHARDVERR